MSSVVKFANVPLQHLLIIIHVFHCDVGGLVLAIITVLRNNALIPTYILLTTELFIPTVNLMFFVFFVTLE